MRQLLTPPPLLTATTVPDLQPVLSKEGFRSVTDARTMLSSKKKLQAQRNKGISLRCQWPGRMRAGNGAQFKGGKPLLPVIMLGSIGYWTVSRTMKQITLSEQIQYEMNVADKSIWRRLDQNLWCFARPSDAKHPSSLWPYRICLFITTMLKKLTPVIFFSLVPKNITLVSFERQSSQILLRWF